MSDGCATLNVVTFMHEHATDATTIAALLQVPPSFILGLSGWESTWGNNRFAREGNNFFSLHGTETAPVATGKMRAAGAPVSLSTFPSYLASGKSFVAQYGLYVRAVSSPEAFAKGLVRSHFNSGSAKTGGNDNFVENTKTAIAMVEKRRAC